MVHASGARIRSLPWFHTRTCPCIPLFVSILTHVLYLRLCSAADLGKISTSDVQKMISSLAQPDEYKAKTQLLESFQVFDVDNSGIHATICVLLDSM